MKKLSFLIFMFTIVALLILNITACDLNQLLDTDISKGDGITQFEVEVPIETSRTIHSDSAVAEVWVKVFDLNGNHVATTGANGVSSLTKNSSSKWAGTVSIRTPFPSDLVFSVWAEDISNQHLFSGSIQVVASAGGTVTIATASGYSIGALGPGGGKIFYDKGSYSNGWRYLEAARSDFSYTWLNIPLDSNYKLDPSGNVVLANNDPVADMTTAHWYWGPPDKLADDYATLKDTGKGLTNTDLLSVDAVSGVTPKITKGKGRPEVSTTDRLRRDLSKTLKTKTIGGKNDWFVPSKDELNLMYTKKATLGMSGGIYWSSSETAELDDSPPAADYPSPYTQYPIVVGSSSYDSEDVHAWVQNFSDGVQSQIWRNELALMRPVRRF